MTIVLSIMLLLRMFVFLNIFLTKIIILIHCPQVALGAGILSNSLSWDQAEVWQYCRTQTVSGLDSKPQKTSTSLFRQIPSQTLPLQPCDSQARVAVAISGSYFLFHLLYFLLLTIRLAQTAGKDAERWNLLLGENNSHLNVVTAFISHHWHLIVIDLPTGLSVWLIARPMFALVGLGWHLLTPAACCLLDQRLRREWPARYSLHILLWN